MHDLSTRWLDPAVEHEREAWSALLERCRHDFHHLPAYAELEARRLAGQARALVVEGAGGTALLPLILRPLPPELGIEGVDARSPEAYPAPLFDAREPEFPDAAVAALVAAMRERGLVTAWIRMHPLLDIPYEAFERVAPMRTHGPTVWIDLTLDEDTHWAEYAPIHRRWIRRIRRDGASVRLDPACADIDAFFTIYAETMERVGASWSDFGRDYIEGLVEVVGERGFFGFVEQGGQVVAAALFTRSCGIVQYHLGGTANAALRNSPVRLLFDTVRHHCKALGDRQFHLGGGVGTREDALFEFKRGFSPRRAHFRSWRAVLDEPRHAALVERWHELGGADAGAFFPAYRAPI